MMIMIERNKTNAIFFITMLAITILFVNTAVFAQEDALILTQPILTDNETEIPKEIYEKQIDEGTHNYTVYIPNILELKDGTKAIINNPEDIIGVEFDLFGNPKNIVVNQNGSTQEYNLEQINNSNEITYTLTVKPEGRVMTGITLGTLYSNYVSEWLENVPFYESMKSKWLNLVKTPIEILDFISSPSGVCTSLFGGTTFFREEEEARSLILGGKSALYVQAYKQPIKENEENKTIYYYRYSYGIDPSILTEDNEIEILGYFIVNNEKKYLRLDYSQRRGDEPVEILDPTTNTYGVYDIRNAEEFCIELSEDFSLSKLTEKGITYLSDPFCVKIVEKEPDEKVFMTDEQIQQESAQTSMEDEETFFGGYGI